MELLKICFPGGIFFKSYGLGGGVIRVAFIKIVQSFYLSFEKVQIKLREIGTYNLIY